AEVVVVAVGDDHIADVLGLQAELADSADNGALDIVLKAGVDEDDAFACGKRPGRRAGVSDEIEIVEHARGLGCRGRWRSSGRSAGNRRLRTESLTDARMHGLVERWRGSQRQ